MFKTHTFCRACGLGKPSIPTLKVSAAAGPKDDDNRLIEVLDLGVSPLANDFHESHEESQGYAPLKLMWCPRCTLAQLSVVVNPEILYKNYPYVTSRSDMMKQHFEKLSDDLMKECACNSVVEIGSNDGSLLRHFMEKGFVMAAGIEPAENLAKISTKNGVITINKFFNEEVARQMNNDGIVPDLIVARHVFCHIDDWNETIHALGLLAGKNTLIAIEAPYLVDTLKNVEWDQIYHEHLSYLSVKALEFALQGSMLHIHDVKHYPIHGGAIVVLLRRNDCHIPPKPAMKENIIRNELFAFRDKAELLVMDLRTTVLDLIEKGKTVVGYGASAKATQWIQACGFTRKHLKFVCDNTAQKLWKLMPGTEIPVVDSGALTRDLPDVAVMFCWNFSAEVIGKEKYFRNHGGKWILPVPSISIV